MCLMERLVSVIIPVYNRQNTISRAVDSVLAQSYQNLEVIIVDDGSTDSTMMILQGYSESKIHIFSQKHKGANAARNRGINEARGEYIAFQDSDDEWLPDKLAKQIAYMQLNNYKVCYCPYELHGKSISIIPEDYLQSDKYEKGIGELLKYKNSIGTPTLIMEKSVIECVGGFDEAFPRLQDYELVIRIAQRYQIGYCAEALVRAYRQNDSITNAEESYKEAVYQLLKKHIDFVDKVKILIDLLVTTHMFDITELDMDYLNLIKSTGFTDNEFNQTVIRHIHRKYFTVVSLLDLLQKKEYLKFENELKTDQFAIYGAGVLAKKILKILQEKGLRPKCFLVSNMADSSFYIEGFPVEIPKKEYRHMPILIAANFDYQLEICRYLNCLEFDNYCAYPVYELENCTN